MSAIDSTVARVQRAIDHIERHLFDPLALTDVAAAAGVSPFHLHRLFTAVFGHSIKTYVRKRRLTEAAAMLRTTTRGVLAIALECQFESQAAFTRAFRALYGVPPARYRSARGRPWYPGLPRASIESLAHLHDRVATLVPSFRELARDEELRGIAEPIDLDAELAILPLWSRLLATLAPREQAVVGHGVVLTSHDAVPLGPSDSLVYFAGVASAAAVDELPHRCTIAAGHYAVFEHVGPPDEVPATLDYVWATWLPRSGCRKSMRPDFERTIFTPGSQPPRMEIWLSIDDAPTDAHRRRDRAAGRRAPQ